MYFITFSFVILKMIDEINRRFLYCIILFYELFITNLMKHSIFSCRFFN